MGGGGGGAGLFLILCTALFLDTTGSGFSAPLPTTKSATTSSTSRPPSLQGGGGAVGGTVSGVREDMKVGDKVVIGVDKERLRELQSDFGGTTAGMIEVGAR